MLRIGDRAPDFALPDEDGVERSLTELASGDGLILYFYPADFTPGCTREARELKRLHDALAAARIGVAGVSPQSARSHRRFHTRHALPFPLLADRGKHVIRAFGVAGPCGIGVRRASFLIDRRLVVRDVVLADFRIARHVGFAAAIAARGLTPGSQAA
jgi:peroxiredoxin Q/BCP